MTDGIERRGGKWLFVGKKGRALKSTPKREYKAEQQAKGVHKEVEKYQGWANHETWALALWLSNDEGLYNNSRAAVAHAKKVAERAWAEDHARSPKTWPTSRKKHDIDYLAIPHFKDEIGATIDSLRSHFEHFGFDSTEGASFKSMMEDIGSMWRVDWAEVYHSFTEE